jgi:hypothetical protein
LEIINLKFTMQNRTLNRLPMPALHNDSKLFHIRLSIKESIIIKMMLLFELPPRTRNIRLVFFFFFLFFQIGYFFNMPSSYHLTQFFGYFLMALKIYTFKFKFQLPRKDRIRDHLGFYGAILK